VGYNGQNINFEEWFVRTEIYFSHRRTTFTAWLLVDSQHSLHPHTRPYHHQAAPKKVVTAKGLNHFKSRNTTDTHKARENDELHLGFLF
jgi:hypothetical protein